MLRTMSEISKAKISRTGTSMPLTGEPLAAGTRGLLWPNQGLMCLLLIVAHFNWIEENPLSHATSAATVAKMRSIYAILISQRR
ncbi:unnamed protein product, partial [Dicrocoelium dendriticum]